MHQPVFDVWGPKSGRPNRHPLQDPGDEIGIRNDVGVLSKPSCQLVPELKVCKFLDTDFGYAEKPLEVMALLPQEHITGSEDFAGNRSFKFDFVEYDIAEFSTCGNGGYEGFESAGAGGPFVRFHRWTIFFDENLAGVVFVEDYFVDIILD
jgi:hypothetical protein